MKFDSEIKFKMNKYISIVSLIMFIGGGRVFAQSQLGSDIDGEDGYDYSGLQFR